MRVKNFSLMGVAGYVAPKHLQAIAETGHRLVSATDPHDSVGVLDRHFPQAQFFTDDQAFRRDVCRRQQEAPAERVDYLVICTPNHLHREQTQWGLGLGLQVICEKPAALSTEELDDLLEAQQRSQGRAWSVLQLRHLPALRQLRAQLQTDRRTTPHHVTLTYVTCRGPWYQVSWKGNPRLSGGLALNIGVHLFDLLLWLFGPWQSSEVYERSPQRLTGRLVLERATVQWRLSVAAEDLPSTQPAETRAYRALTVNGKAVELGPVHDLHLETYRAILAGDGSGLDDARPALALIDRIRAQETSPRVRR